MREPIPIRPVFWGPLGYETLVGGDASRDVLEEEEAFWGRLGGFMVESGRGRGQEGFSVFARIDLGPLVGAQVRANEVAAATPARLEVFEVPLGAEVAVFRSAGERETGWIIKGKTLAAQVLLTKDSPVGVLSKLLTIEELLRQNLHLLPEGLAVKVPRSSGSLDEDWIIRGTKAERILVEKPGVGQKSLSADQFFPFNRAAWGVEWKDPGKERQLRTFDLKCGTPIRLRRSTGAWDETWKISEQEDGNQVQIVRTSELGIVKMRRALDELVAQNPQLVPVGIPVRVARTNGVLEDGWFVAEASVDGLMVERPGVGLKALAIDELVAHNRDRLFGEGVGPAVVPSDEAIAQRWSYARTGRLEGWIWDGFAEGGRGLTLDANGWPQEALREILIVDRLSDEALRRHLARARELESLRAPERTNELVRFVYDQMGGGIARIEAHVALAAARQRAQKVLIGEAPGLLGGGLARHRALLFQVLAEEAGLKAVLVRGFAGIACPCAHAWNELEWAPGERVLVDLARAPEVAVSPMTDEWARRFYQPLTLTESGGGI